MRRYGKWAGNPEGIAEDGARCVAEVCDMSVRWPHYYQCNRKRGYGPDRQFCKQHARMFMDGRATLYVPRDEDAA